LTAYSPTSPVAHKPMLTVYRRKRNSRKNTNGLLPALTVYGEKKTASGEVNELKARLSKLENLILSKFA
jgi:hypothetical protein